MSRLDEFLLGGYDTQMFSDVYPDVATFIVDYKGTGDFANGIPTTLDDNDITLLYYLIVARYKNSHLINTDVSQFKYRLFSIIWQFAPTWKRKVEIQDSLRKLTEDELRTGSKQINDHAFNPSTIIEDGPNPDSGELKTVNEQTKSRWVKSKLEGYSYLWDILRNDVTTEFLNKFKQLFLQVVEPIKPLLYEGDN